MPRPPALSQRDKTDIVLDVLAGECTLTEAGQRAGVSPQAVSNWRRLFVDAGSEALGPQGELRAARSRSDLHLSQLVREVQELKIALAEAHLALRGRGIRRVS